MVFFVSIPVGLLVLILVVQAFTHPIRATVVLARIVLAIVGLLTALFCLFGISSVLSSPSAPNIILFLISLSITIGCFAARNRLARF